MKQTTGALGKGADALVKAMLAVGKVAIIVIMCASVVNVVARYLFKAIYGTEDVVGLMLAAVVGLTIAATEDAGRHVAVTFLTDKFKGRLAVVASKAAYSLALLVCAVIAWRSLLGAVEALIAKEGSMTIEFPTWPFRMALGIGFSFLTLRYISRVFGIKRQRPGVPAEPAKPPEIA